MSENTSGWTTDTVHEHIAARITDADRRYAERFTAQEKAVVVALATVDKEFHEHLAQVRTETATALGAAEKAIAKAELATEKRFESVNGFRAQLSDQVNTFIPRKEAEQRLDAVIGRLNALETRISESLARVHSRLDLGDGSRQGVTDLRATIFGAAGFVSAVVGIGLAWTR